MKNEVDPEKFEEVQDKFEKLAENFNGEYDGWEIEISDAENEQ